MVPDIGIGSSEPSGPDPSQRKHKSLRIGDLVYFAALAEDKVGEGYLHGEVRPRRAARARARAGAHDSPSRPNLPQGFVLDRAGLQAAGPSGIPANFEECIFRVCPTMGYEATTQTRSLTRQQSMTEEEMKNIKNRCVERGLRRLRAAQERRSRLTCRRARARLAARKSRNSRTSRPLRGWTRS